MGQACVPCMRLVDGEEVVILFLDDIIWIVFAGFECVGQARLVEQ